MSRTLLSLFVLLFPALALADGPSVKSKDNDARVVVLKWPNTAPDYQDENLKRIVKSRIARADAIFLPSTDLYQNGRQAPDRTLAPAGQPAEIPSENLDIVREEVARVGQLLWDELTPSEWAQEAEHLRRLLELIWFVSRPEEREPLFAIYCQIGRAAENRNNNAPPFFEAIAGQLVNYYYYLAATLAAEDPKLLDTILDPEVRSYVDIYLNQLNSGGFPRFPLDFELDNAFDVDDFGKEYVILVNGIEVAPDKDARVFVPLGRSDIYLKRADSGHGLSDRLIVDKFEDKAYFVRDVARKRMGFDLIEELMLHPNECTPELAGEILTFLSIYAKLHPVAEIYIAVPEDGNPNKMWIWRYDRRQSALSLVGGSADSFPVRFSALIGTGLVYNTVSLTAPDDPSEDAIVGAATGDFSQIDYGDADPQASTLPIHVEFRVHYNRMMASFGAQFGLNLQGDGQWVERYYTPSEDDDFVVTDPGCTRDDDTGNTFDCSGEEKFRTANWNRYIYAGWSVLLLKDAGLGLGPRIGFRIGWSNMPYAIQPTLNVGYNATLEAVELSERIRPFADVDVALGASIPIGHSVLARSNGGTGAGPVVGLVISVGSTF
jgi:hypothetical protein